MSFTVYGYGANSAYTRLSYNATTKRALHKAIDDAVKAGAKQITIEAKIKEPKQ